ncbi:MAG: mechanosensitive ion channel [bacterium]|nr:mechanosensitive ion channel [bacterium]
MLTVLRHLPLPGLFALWMIALPLAPAAAQETVDTIPELVSILEDPVKRQQLIDRLNALTSTGDEAPGQENGSGISGLDQRLKDLLANLDDGRQLTGWIIDSVSRQDFGSSLFRIAGQAGLALAAGILAWLAFLGFTTAPRKRLQEDEGGSVMERLIDAGSRFLLEIAPVMGFLLVTWLATFVLTPDAVAMAVVFTAATITGLYAIAVVLVRVILSPLRPTIRLLPIADREAAYLVVWFNRFWGVGIAGFLATDLLLTMGAPVASVDSLVRVVGLVLAIMAIVVILQNRAGVAAWIGGGADGRTHFMRSRLGDVWHVVAVLAVAITFTVWVFEARSGTMFILHGLAFTFLAGLAGALASTLARRTLSRLFRIGADLRERFPDLERRSNRYLYLVGALTNVVIWTVAIIAALESWGVEATHIFLSSEGLDLLGRLIAIIVIVVIAVLAWEVGDGVIANQLRRSHGEGTNPRVLTLLPLARNILVVVIGSVAVMTILGELGLDITPLLAGAGVVGLAIGFGAQSLIKDIITGTFILFENQFTVGDWIEAGGKMGGVESVSVRTVQLRDLSGYVHTIPFGDISSVTNMMRDFGYAVIDIGVAYQENTDKVIDVVRRIDEEARSDDTLNERLAGDLEVLGVNDLGDSSVTLRFRIRTLAGYQWGVRREYLRRLKLGFDEAGIEIPYPHMTVYFGEVRGGRTSPAYVRLDSAGEA